MVDTRDDRRAGPGTGGVDVDDRRQWYLDESLRIAVWEMIFGCGPRSRVDELLAEGARWHAESAR